MSGFDRVLWYVARIAACAALLSVGAFVVSELLTDRVAFLQTMWWIPRRWFALVCLVLCLVVVGLQRRSMFAWWLLAFAAFLSVRALLLDWGVPRERPANGLRLVHWNASWPSSNATRVSLDVLLASNADVIVLTDPGTIFRNDNDEAIRAAHYDIAHAGRFALLSRLRVMEAIPLLAHDACNISRFTLDFSGVPLVLEAVDLPSDVDLPRYTLAQTLANELESLRATPPDISLGDFKITRGSASLGLLYPGFEESFAARGTGWGVSYPRHAPLIHIDLTLVGPRFVTLRSAIIDPGAGRHAMQVVDLAARESR